LIWVYLKISKIRIWTKLRWISHIFVSTCVRLVCAILDLVVTMSKRQGILLWVLNLFILFFISLRILVVGIWFQHARHILAVCSILIYFLYLGTELQKCDYDCCRRQSDCLVHLFVKFLIVYDSMLSEITILLYPLSKHIRHVNAYNY